MRKFNQVIETKEVIIKTTVHEVFFENSVIVKTKTHVEYSVPTADEMAEAGYVSKPKPDSLREKLLSEKEWLEGELSTLPAKAVLTRASNQARLDEVNRELSTEEGAR